VRYTFVKCESSAKILEQHLYPYVEHKKYNKVGEALQFSRSTSFGRSQIIANTLPYDKEVYVEFHLGLRHDIVENMLCDILGRSAYYNNTSLTFITNALNLDPSHRGMNRILCKSEIEVLDAGEVLIDIMDHIGFDFLDRYKNLHHIDTLLNDKSKIAAKLVNHSYHRCFRAMVAAKITNRSDYDRLFQMHQQYLIKHGFSGPILDKFNTTFARLKSMFLN